MDVLRVFNNNVVLARDGDREVILTGRGIGFQAKPGQHVDDAKIVRRFIPVDGKDPDHMAQQVAGIPPEIIRLVTDAMNRTGLKEQADKQPTLVMALADHICGAIQRAQRKQNIEYPLEAEVRSLYADEYAKGVAMVDAMNTYLGGALPRSEAVALALHLVNAGFSGGDIMFAGVGKTDREIALALDANIHCFNVESLPELLNINEIAGSKHMMAHIAVRINPNVDAHTHQYITTGLSENKFGINLENLDEFVETALSLDNIDLCGVHFHIGSQITETGPFVLLCRKVGEILDRMKALGAEITIVDMGGGFGIDYDDPDGNPIPDFEHYFAVFRDNLQLSPDQELHFEPGRSIVGQCGSLITRVLYVKEGTAKKFAIVDAGMTDLIRPALYQAHHKIENISSSSAVDDVYDVVGPICESSDSFGTDERLPLVQRGDFLALRSAGAYGEIMASTYNCRRLPGSVFSTDL